MASMLGQEGVFRRQNCGFLTFDVPIAADRKKEFPQMTQMTQMSLPRVCGAKGYNEGGTTTILSVSSA
jgi:hypothetical protein